MQIVNKKIEHKLISLKKKAHLKKKTLKTFVLLKNNQPSPQCLPKWKKTTELFKLIHKIAQPTEKSKTRIPKEPYIYIYIYISMKGKSYNFENEKYDIHNEKKS